MLTLGYNWFMMILYKELRLRRGRRKGDSMIPIYHKIGLSRVFFQTEELTPLYNPNPSYWEQTKTE